MGNACFIENRTDTAKPRSFIKSDDRDLRVQINFLRAQLFCARDGVFQ
jgi:hypothetical protein